MENIEGHSSSAKEFGALHQILGLFEESIQKDETRMEPISRVSLWELIKHLKMWLTNLKRASDKRKTESINALRSVIIAARNTATYIRQINESGKQSHATEAKLSEQWTRLGFELSDLGLDKLAKRCEIKGRYWADPKQFDDSFLEKADVSLVRMEQLARQMLAEIRP